MKHLHFSEAELADRRRRTCDELRSRGLDGILLFRQESMYWLTGYDTFGYVHFQAMVLTADGRTMLLTRSADLRQAQFTSTVEDIRIWVDGVDANPAFALEEALADLGLFGTALGVEYEAYGLTAAKGKALEWELQGFCKLEDASDLVSRLRLVKSPAEIACVRKAAELADAAWEAAKAETRAGVFEGDILAAMHAAIFRAGGDDPANEFIIGSGTGPRSGAMLCRYFTGRRTLDPSDQLTLEFAGTWRHYHACLMRTIRIGKPPARQLELWAAAREALIECEAALRPGVAIGEVFEAHARVLDARGLSRFRLNACGYSLGTTFAPNWMDWPMLYRGNGVLAAPGMVFFIHMIVFDDENGLAATLGRTSLVTESGSEPLSKADLDLTVR
ncbi:MAG: Xaa-Pro peptidase family protein [Hyphomicrobiaceae bacterium]